MQAETLTGTEESSVSISIFLRLGLNFLLLLGALYLQPIECLCWILFPDIVDFPQISQTLDIVRLL